MGLKGAFVWHKKWAEYFFANVDGPRMVTSNDKLLVDELNERLEQHKIPEKILSEDEKSFTAGTMLLSDHHWPSTDVTPNATLASHLAL